MLGRQVLLLELCLKHPSDVVIDFGFLFPLLYLFSRSQVLILLEHLLLHLHGLVLLLGLCVLRLCLLRILLIHDHLKLIEQIPISYVRLLLVRRLWFLLVNLLHHHLLHVLR